MFCHIEPLEYFDIVLHVFGFLEIGSEEEDCHSSGEDEEVVNTNGNTSRLEIALHPSPLALSRFLSRSRTSLQVGSMNLR